MIELQWSKKYNDGTILLVKGLASEADQFFAQVEGMIESSGKLTAVHSNARQEKTFEVDSLNYGGTSKKGDEYYKVKGGNFTEWGVTVWQDVLEKSGIPVANLNAKEPNVPGVPLIAHYVEKQKKDKDGNIVEGQFTPDKVIKLVKSGAAPVVESETFSVEGL